MNKKKKLIDHSKITLLFDVKNITHILLQNILNELQCSLGIVLFYNKQTNIYNIIEISGATSKLFSGLSFSPEIFLNVSKDGSIEEIEKPGKILWYFYDKGIRNILKIAALPIDIDETRNFGFLLVFIDNEKLQNSEILFVCRNLLTILKNNLTDQLLHKIDNFDMLDSNVFATNQDFLYGTIYKNILEASRTNTFFSVSLLEISNFAGIMNENPETAKAVQKSFCDFLQENIRKIDSLGLLYNTINSIIFVDMDYSKSENKLNEMQLKLKNTKLKDEMGKQLPAIEFIYGIAVYPNDGKTCDALLRSAVKTMQ